MADKATITIEGEGVEKQVIDANLVLATHRGEGVIGYHDPDGGRLILVLNTPLPADGDRTKLKPSKSQATGIVTATGTIPTEIRLGGQQVKLNISAYVPLTDADRQKLGLPDKPTTQSNAKRMTASDFFAKS